MRSLKPPTFARTSAIGGIVLAFAFAMGSACTGDAVGIETCRSIETKRCELAPKCAGVDGVPKIKTDVEVENCKILYRDHCLVGLENPDAGNVDDTGKAKKCTDALTQVGQCRDELVANQMGTTMADCSIAVDVDNKGLTPCEVIKSPEHLKQCAFIAEEASTTTAATTAATGGGGAGGGG